MSKRKPNGVTGQGVRNLNDIGPKRPRQDRANWTCPPHIPGDFHHDNTGYFMVKRCKVCKEVVDEKPRW